jgi:enoyl-CoA hydratase/carnithine racemase
VTGGPLATLDKRHRVATITLRRPEALNAISGAAADDLAATLRAVSKDSGTWVVVLTGAGERAFCAGADLKERASFTLSDYHHNRKQIRGLFAALRGVPQPTIASIFGFVLGGGFELALSCDLVVAAEGTQMGLTETRVGLIPAGGGTQLLPRAVGTATAKELVFTGRRIDAAEAASLGLVTEVVPFTELHDATARLAERICGSSPVAVAASKRAIDAALGSSLADGLEIEHGAWGVVVSSKDRAEGIAAFNAKREPRWGNR